MTLCGILDATRLSLKEIATFASPCLWSTTHESVHTAFPQGYSPHPEPKDTVFRIIVGIFFTHLKVDCIFLLYNLFSPFQW